MIYEIRIKGHLSPAWSDWFAGLTVINQDQGEAVLSGELPDQAAFLGVLNQLHALNLTVLSVTIGPNSPTYSPLDE